jgi:hypothetical protein
VFDCLIQFLLTVVLSIEERVFLVEYAFQEGNRYTNTNLVQIFMCGEQQSLQCIVIAHARSNCIHKKYLTSRSTESVCE